MSVPYQLGDPISIFLSPSHLPGYALQTVTRMFIALFFSLLFTFTVGTLAAKNYHAEKIIIPMIDILQSVPVMGFLSITVVGFIQLFPGSLWGAQCASIFAIFTSQVWNMVLSFYQSLRTIPNELREAADMFHLSSWQRFWRVEVPFAMPGLLWNMMLSMSASWFFVVASEAVTIANQTITLPGIGSYIALAISQKNIQAVFYTIVTMLIVIIFYDQLLFRPLVKWSERFKAEHSSQFIASDSGLIKLFKRTYLMKYIGLLLAYITDKVINLSWFKQKRVYSENVLSPVIARGAIVIWYLILFTAILIGLMALWRFIFTSVGIKDLQQVLWLGMITAIRVFAILLISTLIWLPVGVWIGLRPRIAEIVQPLVQFFAAFPVNLLFPIFVMLIVHYQLNVDVWTTPLMLLGTQWYILFNVIAGTTALPKDLKQAADNFGVKGQLWWRRLILPAIFPYYVTGAITAVGSAWNTSTLAEVINWGSIQLHANGLGAYIMQYSALGDFPHLVLGICVMSLYVLILNRLIWRPLYDIAQQRYQMD